MSAEFVVALSTMTTRSFPIIPSPDDSRDHVAEQVYCAARAGTATAVPKTLDLRSDLRPIRDQGTTSTCAAQVAACMKEYQELHDTGIPSDFSPQFVYNYRANAPDEGMHGRDVMTILHKRGAPTEASFPFGSEGDPTPTTIAEAGRYAIKEYARVGTIAALKEALARDGPCYISFPVYNSGMEMWKPAPGEQRQGGHAMTVVGYTKAGFLIRNSWGMGWGDRGHCVYPFADFGAHWDIWTTVDQEGSGRPPAPPPRPIRCTRCMIL
jgi:C1A family cysteine protease